MKKYYVLHEYNVSGEGLKQNKHKRPLYHRIKKFVSLDDATNFAQSVLNKKPVLFKQAVNFEDANRIKNPERPYVIAAYFEDKYWHYHYDGDSDPVPTHEIERTSLDQLEAKLEKIVKEQPDKLYWGIELKLFSIPGGE